MCRSKKSGDAIEPKTRSSSRASKSPQISGRSSERSRSQQSVVDPSTSDSFASVNYTNTGSGYNLKDSWISSVSSLTSPKKSLRDSLPENAHVYEFSEICSATNNFLAKQHSSSSSSTSWRCTIRGNDVMVIQRKFRRPIETAELRERLSMICKSHHSSLIKLRGALISGNYIYLVYDYVQGANLADCLRNVKNPNFTVLSNWMSRIQIATDLAHGLDYIHHSTGLTLNFVHNHIKSTSIIVTEPSFNAKICHFGTAELCGEIKRDYDEEDNGDDSIRPSRGLQIKRSDSRLLKFSGTRGYMPPEFQSSGGTQKSDVFAFGVVVLELLSGEEPLKYRIDVRSGGYERVSIIDTAREAVEGGGGGGGDGAGVRWWVDKRLKDSYPVEVAEKMIRVALECVAEDPNRRPDMGWVTGRISKLYLESKTWAEKRGVPSDFTADYSLSLAPR